MDAYHPNGFDDFRRIIREQSVLLDFKNTGDHYHLSDFHTDTVYFFPPILERSLYRKACAERLAAVMKEKKIDPRMDIDVLLGTDIKAMPLVNTLQDLVLGALDHTRAMYMEEQDGELMLGQGFSLRDDERIYLVHLTGVSFRKPRRVIEAINRTITKTGGQPCVDGIMVLVDRSPEGSTWERDFSAFQRIVGIKSPIIAYPADPEQCPRCLENAPLIDMRGIA